VPWALLHVLVVGLALAATFGTVSMASEAEHAEPRNNSQVASLQRQSQTANDSPESILASLVSAYVPPPQAQVQAPQVISELLLPPPPCVDDPAHPTFCVYTVQPGDTLSGIATLFRLSGNEYLSAVEMLAQSNKPDVISSDQIVPGQKLRLPKQMGIIHTVFSTRTLSEIVALYGVPVDEVIAVAENGIDADGHIQVGEDLLIPNPRHLPPSVPAELPPIPEATEAPVIATEDAPAPVEPPPIETPEPTATPEVVETVEPEPTATPEPEATEPPAEDSTDQPEDAPTIIVSDLGDRPTDTSAYGFIWPAWGPISSYFGPSHPLGIDIDLYADPNEPIGAAKAGIVTFAGGNQCCSYGLYVIVDHGDGTSTLYAHLSQIAVVQGQVVATGQLLGFGGRTGYATGNHLHFEVHVGDNVVDPLLFLPKE
jgi:murein DD-endopeptidase MepM/ murein hydrolase activator NlpD